MSGSPGQRRCLFWVSLCYRGFSLAAFPVGAEAVRPAVAPPHDDETMGIIDIGTTRKNARGNAEAFRGLAKAALVRRQSRRGTGAGCSKASLSHTRSSAG